MDNSTDDDAGDVDDVENKEPHSIFQINFLSPKNAESPECRDDIKTNISEKWPLHQFKWAFYSYSPSKEKTVAVK